MTQFYFAYGSNMERSRLQNRVGHLVDHGMATLKNYSLLFNKQSINKSGKANIKAVEGENIFGVLYELSEEQLNILDKNEQGYKRTLIKVGIDGHEIEVQTYIALEDKINNNLLPTEEYLSYIINGARDHNLPEEYQSFLKSTPVGNPTTQ